MTQALEHVEEQESFSDGVSSCTSEVSSCLLRSKQVLAMRLVGIHASSLGEVEKMSPRKPSQAGKTLWIPEQTFTTQHFQILSKDLPLCNSPLHN